MQAHATIAPTSVVRASPEPLVAEVDGEMVLMSVADGLYFGLNAVASDIWKRLEEPVRVADLCADLARGYDGDAAAIERDVLELLDKLAARRLITVAEDR